MILLSKIFVSKSFIVPAKEEGKTGTTGLYESNRLDAAEGESLCRRLRKNISESRVNCEEDVMADDTMFVKTKELK